MFTSIDISFPIYFISLNKIYNMTALIIGKDRYLVSRRKVLASRFELVFDPNKCHRSAAFEILMTLYILSLNFTYHCSMGLQFSFFYENIGWQRPQITCDERHHLLNKIWILVWRRTWQVICRQLGTVRVFSHLDTQVDDRAGPCPVQRQVFLIL